MMSHASCAPVSRTSQPLGGPRRRRGAAGWLHRLAVAGLAATACWVTGSAAAAEPAPWPTRPVSVVVAFAAGGSTDPLARTVVRALEKGAGQTFLVENVGGAGATLGTGRVAGAAADGDTLLFGGSSALVMAPHLFPALRYDPFTSFEPIGKVASSPYVLLARRGAGLDSFEKLVAKGHAKPSALNYGGPGVGSALHLTIELMLDGSAFSATYVPLTGTAPTDQALLSDTVDFMLDSPSGAVPMVLSDRDTRSALIEAGFQPADTHPAVLTAEIKREYARWGALIKTRNLRLAP